MQAKTCVNCIEYKKCKESRLSWIFFIVGMIATIALRVITVLAHINPVYGQVAWYVGVGGFFIFFVYKFRIERARYKLIIQRNLLRKIAQDENIEKEDREIIGSILCALSSNKDRINYFFIFASSAIALILAFYFDFIK